MAMVCLLKFNSGVFLKVMEHNHAYMTTKLSDLAASFLLFFCHAGIIYVVT